MSDVTPYTPGTAVRVIKGRPNGTIFDVNTHTPSWLVGKIGLVFRILDHDMKKDPGYTVIIDEVERVLFHNELKLLD
jgi:hypothetical protein